MLRGFDIHSETRFSGFRFSGFKGLTDKILVQDFSIIVTGHFLLADFLYVKTKLLIRVTKCFLK